MENQEQLVTQLKAALYDSGQQIMSLQGALSEICDALGIGAEDRSLDSILQSITEK